MANYRGGRINEEVRREVSNIIQNEIKDPRLTAMVSVTAVKVTKDLRYAKVFVSIFGKDEEEKATQILSADPVKAILDIHAGEEKATAWGCDLTYEYVTINADYRS